jgi:hypothetical protein
VLAAVVLMLVVSVANVGYQIGLEHWQRTHPSMIAGLPAAKYMSMTEEERLRYLQHRLDDVMQLIPDTPPSQAVAPKPK